MSPVSICPFTSLLRGSLMEDADKLSWSATTAAYRANHRSTIFSMNATLRQASQEGRQKEGETSYLICSRVWEQIISEKREAVGRRRGHDSSTLPGVCRRRHAHFTSNRSVAKPILLSTRDIDRKVAPKVLADQPVPSLPIPLLPTAATSR